MIFMVLIEVNRYSLISYLLNSLNELFNVAFLIFGP